MQSISEWPGEVRNISKGCGVVMKTLPVAMFQHALGGTIQETFGLACDIASLTHKHPSAAASAGMLSVIHHRLLDGTPLRDAVAQALEAAQRTGRAEFREATALLERSLRLAERPFVHSTMDMLGQGWTADEALALAAYCALTAPNFKTGTLNAINQSGDSDSVGCMTGQLLAATYGLASETEWLSNLELTAVICGLAADLEAMPAWTLDQKRQKHWQYCSWL
jgi:ADP-ribosylglycohydrolase